MRKLQSALLVLLVLAPLAARILPAQAVDCSIEQTDFQYGDTSSKGIIGYNRVRDLPIDTVCSSAERHSTVHMRNLSGVSWVEVGWEKHSCGTSCTEVHVFFETGVNSQITDEETVQLDCGCYSQARWRVQGTSFGANTWNGFYDLTGFGSWHQFPPVGSIDVGFGYGYAMGETGKTPPTYPGGTDAYDYFYLMETLHSNGWHYWSSVNYYSCDLNGYHTVIQSADSWTVETPGPCFPGP